MAIDPKQIEEWKEHAADLEARFRRGEEVSLPGHELARALPALLAEREERERDFDLLMAYVDEAKRAAQPVRVQGEPLADVFRRLLAEREEMQVAIREAVGWMERPGLDTSARWALEDLAAFLGPERPPSKMREALSVLREVEWAGAGGASYDAEFDICPVCQSDRPGPHEPDCRLAALLDTPRAGGMP
jgi:hypothetical protein